LDWQAFSAAATLGSLGFSPFRKRPARGAPLAGGLAGGEGGAVGRVAGIVTPCEAMHVRNAWNAAVNLPPKPNPPAGRSDAQACRALCIVALPGPKLPVGRAVGTSARRERLWHDHDAAERRIIPRSMEHLLTRPGPRARAMCPAPCTMWKQIIFKQIIGSRPNRADQG
jgi:hypothetical protein